MYRQGRIGVHALDVQQLSERIADAVHLGDQIPGDRARGQAGGQEVLVGRKQQGR